MTATAGSIGGCSEWGRRLNRVGHRSAVRTSREGDRPEIPRQRGTDRVVGLEPPALDGTTRVDHHHATPRRDVGAVDAEPVVQRDLDHAPARAGSGTRPSRRCRTSEPAAAPGCGARGHARRPRHRRSTYGPGPSRRAPALRVRGPRAVRRSQPVRRSNAARRSRPSTRSARQRTQPETCRPRTEASEHPRGADRAQ